jgi:hypothetical protein
MNMSTIRRIWDRKVWRFSFITPAFTAIESSHQTPTWLNLLSCARHLFLAICFRIFRFSVHPPHSISKRCVLTRNPAHFLLQGVLKNETIWTYKTWPSDINQLAGFLQQRCS